MDDQQDAETRWQLTSLPSVPSQRRVKVRSVVAELVAPVQVENQTDVVAAGNTVRGMARGPLTVGAVTSMTTPRSACPVMLPPVTSLLVSSTTT